MSASTTLRVDGAGTNNGTFASQNALLFGASGSGEGIASARPSGSPNRNGLDFYTGLTKRLRITNAGSVGIGTAAPSNTLQVNGSLAVGVARNLAGGTTASPTALGNQGYYGLNPTSSSSQDVYQLPAPSAAPGRIYYLRNLSTSNTAYLTTPSGSGIFDAASTTGSSSSNLYTLATSGTSKSVIAISDGTIWVIYRPSN